MRGLLTIQRGNHLRAGDETWNQGYENSGFLTCRRVWSATSRAPSATRKVLLSSCGGFCGHPSVWHLEVAWSNEPVLHYQYSWYCSCHTNLVFRVAFFSTYELSFHFSVVFMELHSQRSLHKHWALVQVTDFFPRWSLLCFPGGAAVKNRKQETQGDGGLIPGLGRSPGIGSGKPL